MADKCEAGFRRYGNAPYRVAVLHGGPGATGEMAPVARELGRTLGVLEPLQDARSVPGQVADLAAALNEHAAPPVILVGHSWGAWLGVLLAAEHPALVDKLILVGSGPFEARYAAGIMDTRLDRLGEADRVQARALLQALERPGSDDPDLLERLGRLLSTTDTFDSLPEEPGDAATILQPGEPGNTLAFRRDVYAGVWPQASALRRDGGLLRAAGSLRCPVVAIHGDHDPHPAEGVREPLSRAVADFRFLLLKDCGHAPWRERAARGEFFRLLREEIG